MDVFATTLLATARAPARIEQGGFKWSLQHLDQEVAHRTSEGLGSGGDRAGADALARASAGVAS